MGLPKRHCTSRGTKKHHYHDSNFGIPKLFSICPYCLGMHLPSSTKSVAVACLVLTATALAGCAPMAESQPNVTPDTDKAAVSVEAPVPSPSTKVEMRGTLPDECPSYSMIYFVPSKTGTHQGYLKGDLFDLGSREFATGTPVPNEAGEIATYVVAEGDTVWGIGDRFCTESVHLGNFNWVGFGTGQHTLEIGEVLILKPDHTVKHHPPQ